MHFTISSCEWPKPIFFPNDLLVGETHERQSRAKATSVLQCMQTKIGRDEDPSRRAFKPMLRQMKKKVKRENLAKQ